MTKKDKLRINLSNIKIDMISIAFNLFLYKTFKITIKFV